MKGCSWDDGQAAAASLEGVWIQASGLIGSGRWPALGTEEAPELVLLPLSAPKGLDTDFAEKLGTIGIEWAAVRYKRFSGPAKAGGARGERLCRDCASGTRWVTESEQRRGSSRQKGVSVVLLARSRTGEREQPSDRSGWNICLLTGTSDG